MSHTLSVDEAAANLTELVRNMRPGDEIVLTQDDRPIARIVPSPTARERRPGRGKGMLVIINDDDEHLDDFREYMP